VKPARAQRTARERGGRALLLRRYPYGESSLVLHLVTAEHGKLHLLAKGAYRPTSGYAGVFDWFDTLEVRWRTPRGGELALATAAGVLVRRRALTQSLERYRAALAMLELADLAAQPERPEAGLLAILEAGLDTLARGAAAPELALVAFDLAFLHNLGLAPALSSCAACGAEPTGAPAERGRAPFAAGAGGRLCARCAAEAKAQALKVQSMPLNLLRIADSIARATPELLERLRVAEPALRDVRELVQRFLEYHMETRPRARGAARAAN
jgi:DNA repair protein RecO (recombination protein O)